MAEQLRIFVSYASEDSAFCRTIVEALRGAGADVWYDEYNMGSDQRLDTVDRELHARPIFILILTPDALQSPWVRDETKWAYNLLRRDPSRLILPVTAAPGVETYDLPLYLQDFDRIEAPGSTPYPPDEASHHLLSALALTPAGEAPVSTASQRIESIDDLLTRGKALIAQKKFAEALPLFVHATQLAPDSFYAWGYLGHVFSRLGSWPKALAAYDQALALDEKQAWLWCNKGYTLNELRRHDEALVAFDRALALAPNLTDAWYSKGHTLNGLQRYQEALAAYDHALAINPDHALAWNNKGAVLNGLQRYQEALDACDRALALNPNNASAWNNKAMALLGLRRYEEAMAAVDRSLALNPEDGYSWDTKGQILNALRQYQEALLCLESAIRFTSNEGEIWHSRAVALLGLGRNDEAEAAEQQARELGWTGRHGVGGQWR